LAGPHVPHHVVQTIAQGKQSEYFVSDAVLKNDSDEKFCSSQKSTLVAKSEKSEHDFDVENSCIARAAFHLLRKAALTKFDMYVSDQNIIEGTSIRPPCRFEVFQIEHQHPQGNDVTVILDVAHNPPALKLLIHKLKSNFPNKEFRFVVGLSNDKNILEFGSILMSEGVQKNQREEGLIHLVEAAYNPKAATIDQILSACPALGHVTYSNAGSDEECTASVYGQIQLALRLASLRGEVVVICGTVFIMSDARQALGIDEPRDSKYITSALDV
jgi:dihydrofolate synthase/folylpolyglutamate synthase